MTKALSTLRTCYFLSRQSALGYNVKLKGQLRKAAYSSSLQLRFKTQFHCHLLMFFRHPHPERCVCFKVETWIEFNFEVWHVRRWAGQKWKFLSLCWYFTYTLALMRQIKYLFTSKVLTYICVNKIKHNKFCSNQLIYIEVILTTVSVNLKS